MECPDHFDKRIKIVAHRARTSTAAASARPQLPSALLASVLSLLLFAAVPGYAQQPPTPTTDPSAAASQIADFFSKVGDEIYEDCIFELSPEQIEVQQALIQAYIAKGASSIVARRLAVQQIHPPKLSDRCEQIRRLPKAIPPDALSPPPSAKKPQHAAMPKIPAQKPAPRIDLASKHVLPQWDCAPGVDYVVIHLKGFLRKLTGGEICNPFEDVVHEVSPSLPTFRLGYTISTGRLFVVSDNPRFSGQTIAWAISGREVCRNNPDPDCLATRAVGPLPPGEYAFSGNKAQRITWGPTIKRNVAGIYLKKLWDRDRFTPQQTAAILARGNIAIHERLKGEMSEACLGLEPKGWAYVASLIKDGRATGVDVYIDEPYPKIAENPPIVVASSFSLTSLFK
jgi:hypothetical protein